MRALIQNAPRREREIDPVPGVLLRLLAEDMPEKPQKQTPVGYRLGSARVRTYGQLA